MKKPYIKILEVVDGMEYRLAVHNLMIAVKELCIASESDELRRVVINLLLQTIEDIKNKS